MQNQKLIVLLFVGVLFSQCTLQVSPTEINPSISNEELQPYFDAFIEAGEARGYDYSWTKEELTAEISIIDENGVAGYCYYDSANPNHIVIDAAFWESANSSLREFVVFHELGHCVLNRGHREDEFTDRSCVSIMASGTGDCLHNYQLSTKENYLDELFDPSLF